MRVGPVVTGLAETKTLNRAARRGQTVAKENLARRRAEYCLSLRTLNARRMVRSQTPHAKTET